MLEYMSAIKAAEKWGISKRRVTVLCNTGRIAGASLVGKSWIIPADAQKPPDARIKSGKYIGFKEAQRAKKQAVNKDGEYE